MRFFPSNQRNETKKSFCFLFTKDKFVHVCMCVDEIHYEHTHIKYDRSIFQTNFLTATNNKASAF